MRYISPTQNTRTQSFITIINRRHWLRLLEIPHKTLLEFFLFRPFGFLLSQVGRLEFATTSDIRETLRHQHGRGRLRRERQPIRGRGG